ncbi:hypothetical protein PGUG_03208 [Meyerozyma guilliermondii ATCC 6260]|uniref:Zn(2)-C6 fungal-type domain-containing protein n=1 Tax=Meyerozyma guilliermondii (strain ATCC 6260 / CBS 566 / DSM 6381 / JCM 1539 / NBRC 10279 / NRRL Y-324) TaxID=294746 RepID=A5DIV7_PICGU|nr:uncharacterized protein PGUG_03208 [Meyerozyma guilliermondii ATCC 6260]EDK39110.2 hypothetical protein PGUG_03208 [Meyerozyma guilliermondii ATCC 6260]
MEENNLEVNLSHPRKRSKVSRACDGCRRKKIRCDGEFTSSLSKVTKACTNCRKNFEECTFSRVPLKRGPSKGHSKDFDDNESHARTHSLGGSTYDPPSLPYPNHSISAHKVSPPNPSSSIVLPPLVHSFQRSPVESSTANGSATKPVLPPLGAVKKDDGSDPTTPRQVSANGSLRSSVDVNAPVQASTTATYSARSQVSSPSIKGPFWKVPYEMPELRRERRESADSVSSTNSNLSNGSRSRMSSLVPSVSVASESGVSDSDDDFHSVRSKMSRQSSQSISPRNSVSSLSSLNGRINSMTFNQQPASFSPPVPYPAQPGVVQFQFSPHQQFPQMPTLYGPMQLHPNTASHTPTPQPPTKVPINNLDVNLEIYYRKFHHHFPILPFQIQALREMQNECRAEGMLELFNLSLNNLNNFQSLSLADNIRLFHRLLQYYPFSSLGIEVNDSLVSLFITSLVLIDYAILLNGDVYALGISITLGILNEFKVAESFSSYVSQGFPDKPINPDAIQIYLPKLYLCLSVIDTFYALSFGAQSNVKTTVNEFLFQHLAILFPQDNSVPGSDGIFSFKVASLLNRLLKIRNELNFKQINKNECQRFTEDFCILQNEISQLNSNSVQFYSLFVYLLKDKYEFYDYLTEMIVLFDKMGSVLNEEEQDTVHDYSLKLGRLLKRLSQSIINVSNFISTVNSASSSPGQSDSGKDILTPFLNLAYAQSYKLIKLCKLLTDSLVSSSKDVELAQRCMKINNDLSIAFNLLNSNLNRNSAYNIGQSASKLIQSRVESYKLAFNRPVENQTSNEWTNDLQNGIIAFVEQEEYDGWL